MSGTSEDQTPLENDDFEFDDQTLRRIRERVLKAETEKLHLDNPRGVINNIEDIIREEIN